MFFILLFYFHEHEYGQLHTMIRHNSIRINSERSQRFPSRKKHKNLYLTHFEYRMVSSWSRVFLH